MINRRLPPQFAPSEPHTVDKTLNARAADEQLIRRLAGALVLQWDALPDALQDLIIDQATIGQHTDEQFTRSQIETFIRKAKTTSVNPPPKVVQPSDVQQ